MRYLFFFEFSVTLRWFSGGFTNTVVVLAAKSLISTTFAVLFNSTAFSVHPITFICQQPQQNRTGFLLCNRPTTLHNCKSCNSNPTLRERKKWKYVEIRPGFYQRWQKKVEFIISWMALPRLTQNRYISNLKNMVRVSLYWCWKMNGNNILPQAIQSNNIYFKQVDHFLFLLAVLSYKKNFGDLSLLWSWIWHGVDVST